MLIATMVFLGVQLFMAPQRANQDTRTSAEMYAALQKMNAEFRDVSSQSELHKYEAKVREEGKAKGTAADEIDRQVLKGYILAADTMHKSGLYRHELFAKGVVPHDYGYVKLDRGYQLLKPKFETYSYGPVWTEVKADVAPTADLPATTASLKDVYDDTIVNQRPLAKKELVWGMFPGYWLIDWLVNLTGRTPGFSYWFAAFLLAMFVRALVWPLAQKQIMFGRQMQQLGPRVKEIQEKYQDKKTKQVTDQAGYQAETMALYKEYGINPAAGCLPMFIQMPLFLAIYQSMHLYKFDFSAGSFLWIHPGATSFLGIPLAPNLGERDYVLVAFYMVSMIVSTMLMPVSDPTQYKQQKLMGVGIAVVFSIMMFFYTLPSAFVLYWIFTNVFSTAQSLLAYRVHQPELKKVQSVKGGVIPTTAIDANGKIDPGFLGKTGINKKPSPPAPKKKPAVKKPKPLEKKKPSDPQGKDQPGS